MAHGTDNAKSIEDALYFPYVVDEPNVQLTSLGLAVGDVIWVTIRERRGTNAVTVGIYVPGRERDYPLHVAHIRDACTRQDLCTCKTRGELTRPRTSTPRATPTPERRAPAPATARTRQGVLGAAQERRWDRLKREALEAFDGDATHPKYRAWLAQNERLMASMGMRGTG